MKLSNKKKDNYFACFSGMGKLENRYVRELIEYYLNLGVEKFILGDNNDPNTEKLSDVIQDYINDGTVDQSLIDGLQGHESGSGQGGEPSGGEPSGGEPSGGEPNEP
jgi:hypothetical protein